MKKLETMKNSDVGIVIMASGLGKRFGGNKLMAQLGDKPMVQWIIDVSRQVEQSIVVVTRNPEVAELCQKQNIEVIFHDLPGRNDTIRLGIEHFNHGVKGCVFCPSDQPFLTVATFNHLIQNIQKCPDAIWRTAYEQEVGAPVYFPQKYFEELTKLPYGEGGKSVIQKHKDELRLLKVDNPDELRDIDTMQDYKWAITKLKIEYNYLT